MFRIGCGLSGRWARNLSGPIGAGLMYPPTINDDVSCAPACAGALALGWREARSPVNCPGCLDRVRSPENRVAERARKETRGEHQLFSLLPNPRAAMNVWSQNAEGSTGSPLEWGSCRGAAHALLGQARGESGERGDLPAVCLPSMKAAVAFPPQLQVQHQYTDSINASLAWPSWLLSSCSKLCALYAEPHSLYSRGTRARAATEQWARNKEQ